jgi:hypothetical protein
VDKTAIQTSVPPAPAPPLNGAEAAAPPPQPKPARRRGPLMRLVLALASLKLTVVLMAFAIGLVFVGTLAQIDDGIWTVVDKYFRSAFVLVPLQLFFPRAWHIPGAIPYPGGWLIGGVMLVNMTLAYFVRYNHFTVKRTGVYILHGGLVLMMASEVVTGLFAVEGQMAIPEGGSSNVVVQNRYTELAISKVADDDPKYFDEVVIPASMLRKPNAIVSDERLPFDVKVDRFMKNSDLRPIKTGETTPATAGEGLDWVPTSQEEVSGTARQQTADTPSAYLTFITRDGKELGTYLTSSAPVPPSNTVLPVQIVKVGDKTYGVELRFKRTYRPYYVHLEKFSFDRWEGTQMARNFSSQVRLVDPEQKINRGYLIRMNDPLRYGGETFYQQDFDKKTEKTTILQVVRNPGWTLPYISCVLVALGMMIHFGMHLFTFLGRRRAV